MSAPRSTRYSPEVRERAYQVWYGAGARNASATRRILLQDADAGEAVPTDQLIRLWSRIYFWTARADLRFGPTKGRTHAELIGMTLAIELGRMDVLSRLLSGADDHITAPKAARSRQTRTVQKA